MNLLNAQEKQNKQISRFGVNVINGTSYFHQVRPNITYKIGKNEFELGPVFTNHNSTYELNGIGIGYQVYPNKNNRVFDLIFYIENKFLKYGTYCILGSDRYYYYHKDLVYVVGNELFLGQGFKAKFLKEAYVQVDFGLGIVYNVYDLPDNVHYIDYKNNDFSETNFEFQIRIKIGFRN